MKAYKYNSFGAREAIKMVKAQRQKIEDFSCFSPKYQSYNCLDVLQDSNGVEHRKIDQKERLPRLISMICLSLKMDFEDLFEGLCPKIT